MATKISELTTATTLDGSELIPVVQGGVTKQASVTDLVSGGELPAYSTSETLTTERWTNGKPIYRKVVNGSFGELNIESDTSSFSTVVEQITEIDYIIVDSFGQTFGGEGVIEGTLNTDYYLIFVTSDNQIRTSAYHVNWVNQPWLATISYTKTTDTASSPVAGVTVTDQARACRIQLSGNQTLSSSVTTKVSFNTVEYDTHSDFDTVNNKFQPSVAGYYSITYSAYTNPDNVGHLGSYLYLRKNGTDYANSFDYLPGDYALSGQVTTDVYMNGTTDYIEAYHHLAGSAGFIGASFNTFFNTHRIGS